MSFRRSTGSRSQARRSIIAVCLLLAASGALADWQDDYKAGIAALDRSDYDRAIQLLSQAIGDKPRERASAIKATGMFYEPYLPHYYLGLAYYGKKDYEKASAELQISAGQGVIGKYAEQKSRMESHLKLCEQQMAAGSGGPPKDDSAAKALAAARERSTQVLGEAGTFLQRRGSELTAEERAAVESAMKALSQAPDTASINSKDGELKAALEAAGRAVSEREARTARGNPAAPPASPRDRPAKELGRMPPGQPAKEPPGTPAPTVQPPPAARVPAETPARPEPPKPIEPAPPAGQTPESAAKMRRGVESYFKGDDEAVISALTGVEQADADFYLASALYRKYLLGRGQDSSLKDEAVRHFRRVAEISPGYRPDPRYFSPKVIAFFQQAAGGQ
jgi:tetratricopeptide (TPR) repeat protein